MRQEKIVVDLADKKDVGPTQNINVGAGEKLTYVFGFFNGSAKRSLTVNLTGPGAQAYLLGLFWGEGEAYYKVETTMVHRAPKTRGETFVRGVLTDLAQADFRGLIKIEKKAQQSEDFLTENILLLSPQSRADSVPSLEIEADDVRAGHAATVGRLDQEQLFYLMSRGFSLRRAEELIVSGFFQPVLERLPQDIQEKLSLKLNQKRLQ